MEATPAFVHTFIYSYFCSTWDVLDTVQHAGAPGINRELCVMDLSLNWHIAMGNTTVLVCLGYLNKYHGWPACTTDIISPFWGLEV